MEQQTHLIDKWQRLFKKATDFDSWGQLVEATNEYNKLAKDIRSRMPSLELDKDEKKTLVKIAACLECRSKLLHSVTSQEELTLQDVKRLDSVLQSLTSSAKQRIPSDLNSRIDMVRKRNAITTPSPEPVSLDESEEEITLTSQYNSLLSKLPSRPGISLVTVKVVKIGLKDASDYIDPFILVSCKDASGLDVCRKQSTPCPTSRDDTYLYYDVNVELQIALEEMNRGTAVFFELLHFKAKRRSSATKCYAFMEIDELKSGPCVIELYKKPIDFRRRKLTLLTKKPLYLHLALTITSE